MKSVHIVGLMVAAGAFGAVAGGVTGALSAPEPATGNSVLLDRLGDLTSGVEALRDTAAENRNAVADVNERVIAVELAMSRRAEQRPPIAPSGDAAEGEAAGWASGSAPVLVRGGSDELTAGMREMLASSLGDMKAAREAAEGAQERFAKSMKIRALPEDERWQYAADTLGLNSVQIDELRTAHTTMQDALKDAVTESTTTGSGGGTVMFRQVDGTKMAEAKTAFNERVDNALNDDQKKAWRDEGFANAMGGGRRNRIRMRAVHLGGGGDGGSFEFTGTQAIEIEINDDSDEK